MSDGLSSQTYIAALDVGLNVFLQPWLEVPSGYQLSSLLNSKVAYKKIVVLPSYQPPMDDF